MENFPWSQKLNLNTDPNWQVKTYHENFLNIIASFIPNEIKKCVPRDLPWINKSLKTLLKKKTLLQLQKTWIQRRGQNKTRVIPD